MLSKKLSKSYQIPFPENWCPTAICNENHGWASIARRAFALPLAEASLHVPNRFRLIDDIRDQRVEHRRKPHAVRGERVGVFIRFLQHSDLRRQEILAKGTERNVQRRHG